MRIARPVRVAMVSAVMCYPEAWRALCGHCTESKHRIPSREYQAERLMGERPMVAQSDSEHDQAVEDQERDKVLRTDSEDQQNYWRRQHSYEWHQNRHSWYYPQAPQRALGSGPDRRRLSLAIHRVSSLQCQELFVQSIRSASPVPSSATLVSI